MCVYVYLYVYLYTSCDKRNHDLQVFWVLMRTFLHKTSMIVTAFADLEPLFWPHSIAECLV